MAGRSGPMVVGVAAAVLAVIGVSVAMSSGDGTRPSGASGPAGPSSAGSDSDAHVVAPRSQQQRIDVPLTLPIQSYVLLAPDRLQVRYTTGVPECYGRLDRAVVTESPSRVVVTLRLRPAPTPADQPCPDIALVEDTEVHLDSPLGDRRVLDGSGLRPVPRGHETG